MSSWTTGCQGCPSLKNGDIWTWAWRKSGGLLLTCFISDVPSLKKSGPILISRQRVLQVDLNPCMRTLANLFSETAYASGQKHSYALFLAKVTLYLECIYWYCLKKQPLPPPKKWCNYGNPSNPQTLSFIVTHWWPNKDSTECKGKCIQQEAALWRVCPLVFQPHTAFGWDV